MRVPVAALSLALLAGACSDNKGGDGTASANKGLTGEIVISGSSTVEPISSAVAELFKEGAPDVKLVVDGPGTGDGFKRFCAGETDISDASRPIKAEEAAACKAKGVEFIELKIAFDGISVMTSPKNDSVSCLTFADLYALAGPESVGFKKWSDAQALATELGSKTKMPDVDLVMTAPGEESGTYDSFIEIALEGIAKERVAAGKLTEDKIKTTRNDYQSSANDNVIIQGIEGDTGSFGWVGFAFASEASDAVRTLEIDGGNGCEAPTAETIADGSYPLARPLFLYVNKAKADSSKALTSFVDFYLGDGIAEVGPAGYVDLPKDQLAESGATWKARKAGSALSAG
ncbi:MAG: substrate-binding domain-containing protein [Actinobacteria bacterium]|nr:substrate-binding domain-containing protein [Actinomycetota bacterium]